MARTAAFIATSVALSAFAQTPSAQRTSTARLASDAMVIERVAEASERDLPTSVLRRITEENIELMRMPREDGTYRHATWQRMEASRVTKEFSIKPRRNKMESVELRAANAYRVLVGVPHRRLLVRRNQPVWIERVDVEYVGEGSAQSRQTSIDVKAWLKPGDLRPIDLPVVTRQATVRVVASVDPNGSYGNIDVSLVQARIVDNADSPYAAAVESAKAILRALDSNDAAAVRASAERMRLSLTATPADVPLRPAGTAGIGAELEMIRDLLQGSETQRRHGLGRLDDLIRSLRR